MKSLILSLLFLIGTFAYGQPKIWCDKLQQLKVKVIASINGKTQFNSIRKSDLIANGLKIKLTDPSIKIIGFVAGFDCHSRAIVYDFSEKQYLGDSINANDNFIRHIWVEDLLVLDCINVKKNGKKFLIKGISFRITD